MLGEVPGVLDGTGGDTHSLAPFGKVAGILRARPTGYRFIERVSVLETPIVGTEKGRVDPAQFAEPGPLTVARDTDGHPAVIADAGVDALRGADAERMAVSARLGVGPVGEVVEQRRGHQPETKFVLREVDFDTFAGAVTVGEAFKGCQCPREPAQVIREGEAVAQVVLSCGFVR